MTFRRRRKIKEKRRKRRTLKRGKKRVKKRARRKVVKTILSWVGRREPLAKRKRMVKISRFLGSKKGRG